MPENMKKTKNRVKWLLSKIKPSVPQDRGRPKELPPLVPDCGWNHGSPKVISNSKYQNFMLK
jgi:hypothetical protein